MTRDEMRAELKRLELAHRAAMDAETAARTAQWQFTKQVEKELIEQSGRKVGDEITTKSGEKRWIARFAFNPYNSMQLVAICYYTLKSGKRSQKPDKSVILADLSMDKEPVA